MDESQLLPGALRTRAPRDAFAPAGGPQHNLDHASYPIVGQAIVDHEAILAISDYTGIPKHSELLGDVGLRPSQYSLEVTDTRLLLA